MTGSRSTIPAPDVGAEGERRFRLLAEAIPQIVWTTRADGYCDYRNGRWFDYTGMAREESAGDGWLEAVHPDDRARCRPVRSAPPCAAGPVESEYRLRRADGVYRWFLARAEPICDDEGRVVRWFGTCTDIDDRRRAEDRRLRESEERLRLAASAARLGYWDWDILADRVSWSESLAEIAGTAPEVFGFTFAAFLEQVHPDDRADVERAVRRAMEGPAPYEVEFRFVRPDGEVRWAMAKGQVTHDPGGRAVRMAGIDIDITRRKEAEERLRRSEERFRASIDTLIDCFAIYTAVRDDRGAIVDFRTEYVNHPACLNNRLTAEEQVGRGLLEMLPAHRESGLFARYCRVVETGEPLEIEEIFYEDVFGGERIGRVFAIRVSRLGDGYVAAWRDITDRKRAEAALGESLERARRIADVSPVVLSIFDLVERRPVYQNREVAAPLDYAPEEILAMGDSAVPTLMHPDDLDRFTRHLARMAGLGDGQVAAFEFRMRHTNGEWHWFFARDSVFARDGDGRATQIISAAVDITDRRRAEEALRRAEAELRESRERFQKFAESDIVGIVFADIHGGLSYANDEYLRIIGYSREEFEAGGVGWAAVTPPEWLEVDRRAIAQALAGAGSCSPFEKEYIRKDGSRVPVLLGFTMVGEVDTVAFVLDISERKAAEREIERLHRDLQRRAEALKEADRRKDEFLAVLAHELRTPLATVGNALRLLSAEGATDDDRRLATEIAGRQMRNLVRLVDDLLDVARIASGKMQLRMERVDAATVAERAIAAVRPFIDGRGQRVTLDIDPSPMAMAGDPTRLEQVLANLLNNASKYSDEGARIAVFAAPEGDDVVFRVCDDGIGIAPELLPGLFEMFAQVDSARERSQGGLGIGLRLVRDLTEIHGGRVSAASDGPGCGSEFTVRIPRLPED